MTRGNRERHPEVEHLRTAKLTIELAPGQCFYRTDKAWEIWQERPLLRHVKRIPRVRVFWVGERDLHLYTNDTDTVIAYSIDDAIVLWEESIGEDYADYEESDPFHQVPDDALFPVWFEDDPGDVSTMEGATVKPGKWLIFNFKLTATAEAWAKLRGRCYLCSTEY